MIVFKMILRIPKKGDILYKCLMTPLMTYRKPNHMQKYGYKRNLNNKGYWNLAIKIAYLGQNVPSHNH